MSGKKGDDWYDESDRDKINMLDSCRRGNINEVAKFLTAGVNVDEEDDDGITALQIAAAKGHRSLAEFLIRKGAKVDRSNYAGMTPFLHACREGHQDIVTLLANNGANIHNHTGLGVSAMALASAGRHLAVVRTLKGLNVAVDPKLSSRVHQIAPTPYMVAFFQMDIQICGFIKQQNANLWNRIKTLDGLDVIRLGQLLGSPEMLMKLNYAECTLPISENKVEIRQTILRGDDQILTQMLKNGAVPSTLHDGLTPFMYAAVSGQTIIADILLNANKGGAIDAQENVLGMTALMFAIVAGESQMAQLLLRNGANPRILSTTREPFSALDLAFFADISRECCEQLCARWLKVEKKECGGRRSTMEKQLGGRKASNVKEEKMADLTGGGITKMEEAGGLLVEAIDGAARSGGAITPARLRRVIESIGKNLRGLALEEPGLGWAELMGMSQTGLTGNGNASGYSNIAGESGRPSRRFEIAANSAALFLEGPLQFTLAEHILRGDSRPQGAKKASADNLILLARQMTISWMNKGHSLPPLPLGQSAQCHFERMTSISGSEGFESDGMYSAAQRNADRELKKHHKYESARKSSRTPILTPRMMRNSAQECVKKSPSVDAQRTMRKAPHRLGHFRAASGGSLVMPPDSPRTPPTSISSTNSSPRPSFFLQSPQFPQHLTKEFVQNKLREWSLEKPFLENFAEEEIDELTFATLREEEVRQVISRRSEGTTPNQTGAQSDELSIRFVRLIQEIKRCTASSELL